MKSSTHRANILSSEYSYAGTGVAADKDTYYATQTFGDLIAEMITEPPDTIPIGSKRRFTFRFLGDFPREDLTVFLQFPDKGERFYLPDRSYYTGIGPYEPIWDNDEQFSLELVFDKGKGIYELVMGQKGTFYPNGITFYAE